MDPVIQKAIAERDYHRQRAERLEAFLATYFELSKSTVPQKDKMTDQQKVEAPKARGSRPRGGIGADTLAAAVEIVTLEGPMSTRDMLPMILAKGIEVGGGDPVATLSARISNKGKLRTYNGKWHLITEDSGPKGSEEEEAVSTPATDAPTASVVHSNYGGSHGPALV
jgi:hypothetical protein